MKTLFNILLAMSVSFVAISQKSKSEQPVKKDNSTQVIYVCPMHGDITSATPGKCSKCGTAMVATTKEKMNAGVTRTYACTMHPNEKSDHPGKCGKCGMALVETGNYACPMHPEVTSHFAGTCKKCGMALKALSPKEQMKSDVTSTYSCPMHPDVTSDKPGKCPKCGMALKVTDSKH